MMDSARDFDLLGESVPQVRVSARTPALLGFFQLFIYSDSLLSEKKYTRGRELQAAKSAQYRKRVKQ